MPPATRRRALGLGLLNGVLWSVGNGLTTGTLVYSDLAIRQEPPKCSEDPRKTGVLAPWATRDKTPYKLPKTCHSGCHDTRSEQNVLVGCALFFGLASAAHAQYPVYPYGYAVPVVPVAPQPSTAFSSPYTGTCVGSPGYFYYSSAYVGTVQAYSPYVGRNSQVLRSNSEPLYPMPSHYYRWSGRELSSSFPRKVRKTALVRPRAVAATAARAFVCWSRKVH
jgi:hypothetical protein